MYLRMIAQHEGIKPAFEGCAPMNAFTVTLRTDYGDTLTIPFFTSLSWTQDPSIGDVLESLANQLTIDPEVADDLGMKVTEYLRITEENAKLRELLGDDLVQVLIGDIPRLGRCKGNCCDIDYYGVVPRPVVPEAMGYIPFAVTDDCDVLCFQCVEDPTNPVHEGGNADGWRVDGWSHSGEVDESVMCDHCNRVIVDFDDEEQA